MNKPREIVFKGNGAVFKPMADALDKLCQALTAENEAYCKRKDYLFRGEAHTFHWTAGAKFVRIDEGEGHGAYMVEIATGELYNIQGYGRPDRNKKRKADLGHLFTVDPAVMFAKRYNYLDNQGRPSIK